MKPTILVTGATGTIGSFVVAELQKQKAGFVALSRSEDKAKRLNEKGVETVIGDFSDPPSLERALDGIDRVFLLSVTSPDAPKLQGNMINAALDAGVSHIVKVSALGASSDSPIGIARYHAAIEEQLIQSGLQYTLLRPHSFMQNLIFDSETIRDQGSIYAQMGEGRISMVDARDIAAVAVKALTESGHAGKTYELTGPEALSYNEIAAIFSSELGKPIRYVPVTSVDSRSSMLDAGMPEWLVEDLVTINTLYAQGNGAAVSRDVAQVTGRNALSVTDFIRDFKYLFQ